MNDPLAHRKNTKKSSWWGDFADFGDHRGAIVCSHVPYVMSYTGRVCSTGSCQGQSQGRSYLSYKMSPLSFGRQVPHPEWEARNTPHLNSTEAKGNTAHLKPGLRAHTVCQLLQSDPEKHRAPKTSALMFLRGQTWHYHPWQTSGWVAAKVPGKDAR